MKYEQFRVNFVEQFFGLSAEALTDVEGEIISTLMSLKPPSLEKAAELRLNEAMKNKCRLTATMAMAKNEDNARMIFAPGPIISDLPPPSDDPVDDLDDEDDLSSSGKENS